MEKNSTINSPARRFRLHSPYRKHSLAAIYQVAELSPPICGGLQAGIQGASPGSYPSIENITQFTAGRRSRISKKPDGSFRAHSRAKVAGRALRRPDHEVLKSY
jgi:hypothetical protein